MDASSLPAEAARRAKNHALRCGHCIVGGVGFDLQERRSVSTCTLGMVITCRTFPENGATTCISIFMASNTARRSPTETVSPGFHGNGNHHRRRRRVHNAAIIAIDLVRDAVHFDPVTQSLARR